MRDAHCSPAWTKDISPPFTCGRLERRELRLDQHFEIEDGLV
jgi:hypothetical protein